MADLYLERIGLARPTIVKRDNDGEIERLESTGLDIASLVAFWRRCFDLNGLLFEKITLHCKSKDFNAMGQRTLATCRSVRELLAEQGVECVIDNEWFENRKVKNEQFDTKMTNFEKIKNMSIDELAEKLNESFACDHCPIEEFCNEHNSEPHSSCTTIWEKWLKSEVQNNDISKS